MRAPGRAALLAWCVAAAAATATVEPWTRLVPSGVADLDGDSAALADAVVLSLVTLDRRDPGAPREAAGVPTASGGAVPVRGAGSRRGRGSVSGHRAASPLAHRGGAAPTAPNLLERLLERLRAWLASRVPPEVPAVEVDLDKYAGTWYEICSLPRAYSRGLTDRTATYVRTGEGRLAVENGGSDRGRRVSIKGTAVAVSPGRLRVTFRFLGGLVGVSAPYVVMDHDQAYNEYALVSNGRRRTGCWVLSRKPTMSAGRLRELKDKLAEWGFAAEKLEAVVHTA